MIRWIIGCLGGMFLAGCGGAAVETETVQETSLTAQPVAEEAEPAPPEPEPVISEVTRAELDEVLSLGPPHILAMVQTDSYKEKGRFKGWSIVSFRVDASEVLGLREGDVVTRVNGLPLERPEQYFEVFERLKTADAISFNIIRDGEAKELSTPIQP